MISETGPETDQSHITPTTGIITQSNRWDHFLARIGWKRNHHCVDPGLYNLGDPSTDSPVFVTANYTLSFDALRSAIAGIDAYILVLDTKGINVWCAAGKGTFGTDELVHRIESTRLPEIVRHRTLILPQLGAPGVVAHEVKKRSGFRIEYGPVRSVDLPGYLETHQATPEMRRVSFTLRDRLKLIPVEVFRVILPFWAVLAIIWIFKEGSFFDQFMRDPGLVVVLVSGMILFPLLLPWIPTPDFSTKGFVLGGAVTFPFALLKVLSQNPNMVLWRQIGEVVINMLIWVPAVAFLALFFTGATTFTSRSGVRQEIFKYIPIMACLFGSGILLGLVIEFI